MLIWGMLLALWSTNISDNTPDIIRSIEEAHEIAEKLGNARLRAEVLWIYGGIEMREPTTNQRQPSFRKLFRLGRLLKDKHQTAHGLLTLGMTASQQTHYDAAFRYEEESLQILHDLSDRYCSALSLLWLGWNAHPSGKTSRAIEHLEECLFTFREIEAPYEFAPMVFLGRLLTFQGNIQKAKDYLSMPSLTEKTNRMDRYAAILSGRRVRIARYRTGKSGETFGQDRGVP